MSVSLALGQWKILLRSILRSIGQRWGSSTVRGLEWEETFEDAFCLPLGRVSEVDPYVHAARPAESRVQAFNVIRSGK